MFSKNNKKRLYWLIDQYLSNKINARTFCDEYYYSYDLEIDQDGLSEEEAQLFSKLSTIINRFSEFDQDFKAYPGTYYTDDELRKKVLEAKKNLK